MKLAFIFWIGGIVLALAVAGSYFFTPVEPLMQSDNTYATASSTAASTTVAVVSSTIATSTQSIDKPVQSEPKEPAPPVVVSKPAPPVAATTTIVTSTLAQSKIKNFATSTTVIHFLPWITWTTTTTNRHESDVPEPVDRTITAKAIVALLCHGDKDDTWKGSGNIINPQGYILTNRHVAEDAKYCEVAVPDNNFTLPSRVDIQALNPAGQVSGWRPYKAINYYVPAKDDLGEDDTQYLDFAIMKIDAINEGCELFDSCGPLPTVFPYNPISNFYLPTSTAPNAFPVNPEPNFYLPQLPFETISYGYPSEGVGAGLSHVLRANIGYAIAYLPGDKKFIGQDASMLRKTLGSIYGGSSGSGVFYKGHIIGLVNARFIAISQIQFVVPMPFISAALKEANFDWILTQR